MAGMRLIYLTYDGRAKMEKTRTLQTREIEMPDGNHAYTNNSVWQDARRLREPLVIINQGVFPPMGATMAKTDALLQLYEIKLAEKALKPPSVSTMWQRTIYRFVDWILTNGVILGVVVLVLAMVAQTIMGG